MHRLLASCALWLLLGCAKEEEPRAPAIGDCGSACNGGSGSGYGGPLPGHGTSGTTNPDNDGGSSPRVDAGLAPGTLTGTVDMLIGDALATRQGTESDVEINAPGAQGERVTARYESDHQPFSLPGVQISGNLWVGVRPLGDPIRELLTTLQRVDTSGGNEVSLAVADRTSLTDILLESLLVPIELDDSKGHMIIYFRNEADQPVSGVSVLDTEAVTGAVIAYDAGSTYSDTFDSSDLGGSVLLVNMIAPLFPGEPKTVEVRHDGLDFSFQIQAARDAITFAVVEIP